VPFGFEPLGIYYNRDLIEKVPTLWKTLPDILKKPVIATTAPLPEGTTTEIPKVPPLTDGSTIPPVTTLPPPPVPPLSATNDLNSTPAPDLPAFTDLGYGRATPASMDIIALLTVQKK
jgi:hypothetical protein